MSSALALPLLRCIFGIDLEGVMPYAIAAARRKKLLLLLTEA